MPVLKAITIGIIMIPIILLLPSLAYANEHANESFNETVGPYVINVTMEQSTPFSSEIRFLITVLNATTQEPVLDARVRILTINQADGTEGWALALNFPRNPELYEGDLKLDESGTWNVDIEVSGPLEKVLFRVPSIEVKGTIGDGMGAAELVLAGVSLIALAGGVMFIWLTIRRHRQVRIT